MAVVYENVNPTLIPNTFMQKLLLNGVHKTYVIAAVDGYVLHDKENDWPVFDDVTGEETTMLGFVGGDTSCAAWYDFSPVTVTGIDGQPVTAYGEREFYAVPESDVPADQIFGVPDDEHEVM